MNQELYNQLLDGASVIVAVQKMEAAIEAKKNRWADLCVDYSEGEENIKKARGSYGKWKGWGTFMMIFGLGNAAIVAFAILSVLAEEFVNGNIVPLLEIIPFIVIDLILVGFAFIGLLLLIAGGAKRRKRVKKAIMECKGIQEAAQAKIDKMEDEIDQMEARMRKYILDNQHRLAFLPSDYRNPYAIGFMIKALENMRADSLKELVNLYEQEQHFLEQEHILNNSAEMQRIHNENMRYTMECINRNQEKMKSDIQFMQTMQFISMLDD